MKKARGPFKDIVEEGDLYTETTYTATGLQCDTKYSFRGRARNPVCASKYSENVEIKTEKCSEIGEKEGQSEYRKTL